MTDTGLPDLPGSRRVLPVAPSEGQIERVRELLNQSEHWVLRGDWKRYLDGDGDVGLVPIERLVVDQRVAAASWVSQQRHALYATLEGGRVAPDGWLEKLPLYRALSDDR